MIPWMLAFIGLLITHVICGSPGGLAKIRKRHSRRMRVIFLAMLAVVLLALRRWAAKEIRQNLEIEGLVLIAFEVWTAISVFLFSLFGLSIRNDAVERAN